MYNRETHMACPLKFTVLFVFKFCIFGIVECANNTDVISHCIDKQPCIGTYADIYNALTVGENSFNIRSALYPAKKPASVLVFVNVYGPNGTQSPRSNACKYTWSTNCLFVTLPAAVLQVMSLGSILVDPRTQHLDITLPSFCCKVSKNRREKMIEDVIAELQDLAVRPAIPDPRLNTAECVIKGHDLKIMDTGRRELIYAMLFCSFMSVMLLGPLLADYILRFLKLYDETTTSFCFREEKPIVHAADLIVAFVLLVDIPIICYYFYESWKAELPMIFMIIFIVIIIVEGPVIVLIIKLIKYKRSEQGTNQNPAGGSRVKAPPRCLYYYIGVNLVLYHFLWLLIGTMITPTWGSTIFLAILLYFIVLFLAVFYFVKHEDCVPRLLSGASFVGFFFTVVVPILAGNSFYGRETAADILKVVLFYTITGLIPKTLKFLASPTSNNGEPENPVSALGPTTSEGKTPVPNPQTTKNPPFAEKADNGVELLEIKRQEDERGLLLKNPSG